MRHLSTCSCSRRSFLRGGGLTLAGFGIASLLPGPLVNHVLASGPGSNKRFLFIFLRGGNDGLNAVIPHGDTDYSAMNRPTLYISPTESIDLNGFASLHPALADLVDVFDSGDLAVVHRVGYQNSTTSHFDGQRIWENGDPSRAGLFEGWLYRYIRDNAVAAGVNLPVLTSQSQSPLLLNGTERFVNIANPSDFQYVGEDPKRAKYTAGWREHYAGLVGLEPYRPVLSQTGVKLVDALDDYDSWNQSGWNPVDPVSGWSLFPVSNATNPPHSSGTGPRFPTWSYNYFRSLKICALSLLESADGGSTCTRVAGTQLGGWDLHDNQGKFQGDHATNLEVLGYGLRSLYLALSGAATDPRNYPSIWNDTVVATMSEFGRTSRENGSFGTDHAAASCMFVQGGSVNGGVYNCDASTWDPGVMFGINNKFLLERTDYRSIFWEVLRDHMGAGPQTADSVFPGYDTLGLGGQELNLIS